MKKLMFILASLVLSSCSIISYQVDDWPELTITVHDTSLAELNATCWSSLPVVKKMLGAVVFGCAMYDLDKKTCDIYIMPNSPRFILDHEIEHCMGGDDADGSEEKVLSNWLDLHDKTRKNFNKDAPPKMLEEPKGHFYWDHSSKFGFIPKELAADAKTICQKLDTSERSYKAIGYHPTAKDLKGKTFVSGGYFCVPN
jgi:hypothetical protein